MKRILKRSLAAMLTVIMLVTFVPWSGLSWLADIFATTAEAATTTATYTLIRSPEDLNKIRKNLSGSYRLANDIDMSKFGVWTPIGSLSAPFKGVIDGNGYSIIGLNINLTTDSNGPSTVSAAFIDIASGATIKNLGIEKSSVNHTHTGPGSGKTSFCMAAGFVGDACNSTVIENCFFTGEIIVEGTNNAYVRAGSIGGSVTAGTIIRNCYGIAYISAKAEHKNTMVGGIAAWNEGATVDKCYSGGSLYVENTNSVVYLGGIVASGSGTVSNSVVLLDSIKTKGTTEYGGTSLIDAVCPFSTLTNNKVLSEITAIIPNKSATSITKIQASSANTYTAIGWNFDSVWEMNGWYPELRKNESGYKDKYNVVNEIPTDYSFKIPVKAIEAGTNKHVPVEGADVEIFLGKTKIASRKTLSDGIAYFTKDDFADSIYTLKYIKSNATVVAKVKDGSLTLSSEKVSDKGEWIAEKVVNVINGNMEYLLVDEPIWFVPTLKVMIEERSLEKCKSVLREYSSLFAQTTNGHVVVNKFDIVTVPNRYTAKKQDKIRELAENNDIDICMVSNDETGAYGSVQPIAMINDNDYSVFKNKGSLDHSTGGFTVNVGLIWCPISGNDAKTLCHESGHYLLGFWDEYCSAIGINQYANKHWYDETHVDAFYSYDRNNNHISDEFKDVNNKAYYPEYYGAYWTEHENFEAAGGLIDRPDGAPINFGVMDVAESNLEMSTESVYNQIKYKDENSPKEYSFHYYYTQASCEDKLIYELGTKTRLFGFDYTKVKEGKKHTAQYSFAGGSNVTINYLGKLSSFATESVVFESCSANDISYNKNLCEFAYAESGIKIVSSEQQTVDLEIIDVCDEIIVSTTLSASNNYSYVFESDINKSYTIKASCINEDTEYNKEYDVRFYPVGSQYGFNTINDDIRFYSDTVNQAVVVSSEYIASDSMKEYNSITDGYRIVSSDNSALKGCLEFTIPYNQNIDYSSVNWFLKNGNEWISLETGFSYGEHGQYVASCNFAGTGIYYLMAKESKGNTCLTPTDFTATTDGAIYDGEVIVNFNDTNENVLYYNVFYGTEPITSENYASMNVQIVASGSKETNIWFDNSDTTYYFAIQAVANDGSKSEISESVICSGAIIDSDSDGFSDSWISTYSALAELEDVAGTDSDNDGLTNLEEYEFGTNPLTPDTDGDNVYDIIEIRNDTNPLEPMTDGVTDDYVVVYGTPDVYINENLFALDESTVTCTINNDTAGKAMRTYISLYDPDGNLLEMAVVDLDAYSSVEYTFPREYLVEGFRIVLDEDKITRDTNYDNNAFVYVPAEGIVAKSNNTIVTKGENVRFDYELIPENASKIVSVSSSDSTKILVDKYGTITGKIIGKCTVTAVTATGHSCSMEVVVEPIPGAGSTDFDCRIINDNQVEIIGYVGSDINVEVPSAIAEMPVVSIGYGAFVGCTFESSILPETLKTIDEDAFYNCVNLKSITIPDSVVEIGDYAFDCCSSLESVFIGKSVKEFGKCCFRECTKLKEVYYNAVNAKTHSLTNYYPFYDCTAIEKCVFSSDVETIPQYLFYKSTTLTDVVFGCNIKSIGTYAFYGCSSLSNLILPENLTSIAASAFRNCSSIYSAIIPDSVSSIGSYAFSGCTNLTDISIANDKASVYGNSFNSTAYYNSESNWKDGLLYIDNHLITGKDDLINGVIKSGTVRIANSAFVDNTSLTRITIPKTVEIIGTSAFSNCTGLTSVVIPTSVEQIESSAFTGCTSLGQVSVYNKDCIISNSSTVFPETAILCGYSNSTTQEYATNFSRTFVSLHEHDYSYVVKVEPTVMNEGYIERSCSCGDAITETIPSISQNCIVKNNMLIGLEQGLSVEKLLERYLVSDTATITLSREVVGTGTVIEIVNGDGICEEYEIVIFGDVNGDSWYDGQDAVIVSAVANGLLTEAEIGSCAYMAADCNADGKVDDQDVALLQSAGLMIEKIEQSNTYNNSGNITVTFNGNGATDGTMESQGFEFGVEQNLELNEYSRSYKIAYELNGGVATITNANTDSVYLFKSWNSTQNGNGLYTYSNGEAVTNPKGYSSGNAELYAQWIGGGVRIPTPTKEYNEFVGWYTDPEFKNEFIVTDELYYPTDNITLYAKWQPHEFEVTFNDVFDFDTFDFSEVCNGSVTVDHEEESLTIYSTAIDTYTLNYNKSDKGYMTLIPGHTYRFSYDWENLSDVDETLFPYVFAYDSLDITGLQIFNYYKLSAPARSSGVHVFTETIPEGYPYVTIRFGVFGSEQGGSIVKFSNVHIQDITNLDGIADDVSGPMNDNGETVFNVSVGYGENISSTDKLNGSLPTITRTGYTFAGWYDAYDENGNGAGNLYDENSVMGATDLKLYAKWIKEG